MEQKPEVWKELKMFAGYDISDHGRIRSWWIRSKVSHIDNTQPPSILKATPDQDGRLSIVLKGRDGKHRTLSVGKLVLTAFYRHAYSNEVVQYRDGNPSNCHRANLYYCERGGSPETGRRTKPVREMTDDQKDKIVRAVKNGEKKTHVARKFRIHRFTLNRLLATHKGL